jgi:hypothetical protein
LIEEKLRRSVHRLLSASLGLLARRGFFILENGHLLSTK